MGSRTGAVPPQEAILAYLEERLRGNDRFLRVARYILANPGCEPQHFPTDFGPVSSVTSYRSDLDKLLKASPLRYAGREFEVSISTKRYSFQIRECANPLLARRRFWNVLPGVESESASSVRIGVFPRLFFRLGRNFYARNAMVNHSASEIKKCRHLRKLFEGQHPEDVRQYVSSSEVAASYALLNLCHDLKIRATGQLLPMPHDGGSACLIHLGAPADPNGVRMPRFEYSYNERKHAFESRDGLLRDDWNAELVHVLLSCWSEDEQVRITIYSAAAAANEGVVLALTKEECVRRILKHHPAGLACPTQLLFQVKLHWVQRRRDPESVMLATAKGWIQIDPLDP